MIEGILVIVAIIFFLVISVVVAVLQRRREYYTYEATPEEKGNYGEQLVAKKLGKTVVGEGYVINDILFCDAKGNSCQIDHVYINRYGIWVIETKNYGGYIYGEQNSREWVQVLNYGATKNKFYNPVKQNATHIYRLSVYLGVKDVFHNVVCFSNSADLSCVRADNIYRMREIDKIKNLATDITLSDFQMATYYGKLEKLKERNDIGLNEHIQNIRNNSRNVENGICPRCGGSLVLRKGKNGEFFGCSNYPRCKFTKKVD